MLCRIDHVVLAAPDLDRACTDFEAATSIRPVFGGAHPGGGTRNALVAFDGLSYLEIIAPDPAQPATPMSASLASLARPTLLHWAARGSGLQNLANRVRAIGWTPTEVRRMSRTPPTGARLEWELMGLRDHRHGGLAPFFIDWLNSPHPATTSPRVGALVHLQLQSREPAALRALMAELGIDVAVTAGDSHIELKFASPRGQVSYAGLDPSGFTLGR